MIVGIFALVGVVMGYLIGYKSGVSAGKLAERDEPFSKTLVDRRTPTAKTSIIQ